MRLFGDGIANKVSILQEYHVLKSDQEALQCCEQTWNMEFNSSKCQVLHITWPQGYKTFFMLNLTEYEISTIHKN